MMYWNLADRTVPIVNDNQNLLSQHVLQSLIKSFYRTIPNNNIFAILAAYRSLRP